LLFERLVLEVGIETKNLGFGIEEGGGRLPIPTHHFFERRKL